MDALPVTEKVNVPFKSVATSTYRGQTVGVMHACGHDVHTAVLMGVAQTLTAMRAQLPGNVLFIFQPAEEGAPEGEEGGAALMLKEGVFDKHPPKAVFALHVQAEMRVGEISVRAGPFMAASDFWRIEVMGKQSHGARPWQGVDPIVTSAQIINALQTVVSRQVDITLNPAVLTVGRDQRGRALQHRSGPRRAHRHDSHVRHETARGDDREHAAHGGEHRHGQWGHGHVQDRTGQQSRALQRPGSHREDGAHADARGRRGQHAACRR